MSDDRVNALEQEVNKLKETIEQLTARIEVLEGDDGPQEEKKSPGKSSNKSKKKTKGSSKKGKKEKKASASKKNAKKAQDDKKTRLKNQKSDFYHVVGKKMYVEVPEPFKFGTKHKSGPARQLQLNYAYGYNGNIPGNIVRATGNDDPIEIAYALAGAVVVINTADATSQRFFTGHNEDVVSIAKHPSKNIIASGQRDPKGEGTPYVCIFDTVEMEEKGRLVDFFARSVCSVGFTFDGNFCFAVGEDDARTGGLFDVKAINDNEGKSKTLSKPVENAGVSKDEVWGQAHAPELVNDCYVWATWGKKQICWWTYNPAAGKGERLVKKVLSSRQETGKTQSAYNCALWTGECNLLVGLPDGCIYHFHKNTLKVTHWWDTGKSPIVSLDLVDATEGVYRATDAKGHIYEYNWNKDAGKHKHEKVRDVEFAAGGRVTHTLLVNGITYYGTKACALKSTNYDSGEEQESQTLMNGFTKEIWALAAHPSKPWLVVGCDDKRLRLWDYEKKEMLYTSKNAGGVRTADFSRCGNQLVLGTTSGAVQIFDISDLENVPDALYDKKICKEEISAVAFSADGQLVIAGSWDQTVRVIKHAKGKWKLWKTMKGHTSSVTHLCMSEDGHYARSCSKDVETLFWDINAGKRVDYCDVNTIWDRWNCIFGWPVQGLFFDAGDPTDVNCCEISGGNENDDEGGKKVVASGDDTGHVTIFKYPILEEKPAHVDQYLVHSAHVTNVRFSEDDAWLFSVGGGDLACFQWSVSDK